VPLLGRPMVEWSLDAFRAAGVESFVIARPPAWDSGARGGGPAVDALDSSGVRVVDGGKTRAASVANAFAAVETELVAIHDAARPLVTAALILGVLQALGEDPEASAAIAAAPVTDTIKRTSRRVLRQARQEGHSAALDVEETLDRGVLWAAQTPQVFRVAALRDALAAHPEPGGATDEATLIEANGGRVLIHPAPPENLKVTTPRDLELAGLLLTERASGD
jgi:2-C-methyl-D-erythritol 4-phosphate cytidylyltransferase